MPSVCVHMCDQKCIIHNNQRVERIHTEHLTNNVSTSQNIMCRDR